MIHMSGDASLLDGPLRPQGIFLNEVQGFMSEEDQAAVEAGWEAGKERGVVGSPHFFTPSGDFFCPVLDIKRVDGQLAIKPDIPAFEEFVAACLT